MKKYADYKLLKDSQLSSVWSEEHITDKATQWMEDNPELDAIILYSIHTKKGMKMSYKDPLFYGGNHQYIGAAVAKDGYELEDLYNDELKIAYVQPSVYYNPDYREDRYQKTSSIVPRLSFLWFILTLILTLGLLYVMFTVYPRDRYYHVKNKRVVIEPMF